MNLAAAVKNRERRDRSNLEPLPKLGHGAGIELQCRHAFDETYFTQSLCRRYSYGMSSPRRFLQEVAREAMRDRGFEPDFSQAAQAQVAEIEKKYPTANSQLPRRRDLRSL